MLNNGHEFILSGCSELKSVQQSLDCVYGPGMLVVRPIGESYSGPLYAFSLTDTRNLVTARDQRNLWIAIAILALLAVIGACTTRLYIQ